MSTSILLAYILCIASTILCVVYGLITWNKGDSEVTEEDKAWAKEEQKIEHEFE